MQGMRVAAEPPFRTSLCYRVRHDTGWHMPKMMPFKRAAVVELRRNVRRFNILAAFFSTLPSLSLKLHSAQ